jgi:hypothetical protein
VAYVTRGRPIPGLLIFGLHIFGSLHSRIPISRVYSRTCVFITAVPLIKLFAWGEGESGGHVLRETRSECVRPGTGGELGGRNPAGEEEGVSMQKQCMRWTLCATARCRSRSTNNLFSLPSGSDSRDRKGTYRLTYRLKSTFLHELSLPHSAVNN